MAFLWGKMYHLVPYPRYNFPIAGPSWQPSKTSTIGTCFEQTNLRNDDSIAWETAAFWAIMRSYDLWPLQNIQQHRVLFQTFWPTRKHDSINQGSPSSPRWPTFLLPDLDRPCQVWHHECEDFLSSDFSISWWPNCLVPEKMGQYHSKRRNITRWTRHKNHPFAVRMSKNDG